MKLVLLLQTFIFAFFLSACQVKEKASSGLISGHLPTGNVFTVNSPTAKTYITGDLLSIVLSFPYNVDVTGTPQISLTIGATARVATYSSGAGTKNLTFNYTIVGADNDTDGVTLNSLSLAGGTLKFDNNGTITDCDVATVTTRTFTSVLVDNTGPTVSSGLFTNTPQYYRVGADIVVNLTFSERVYVTNTPRLRMGIDTGSVYANYTSGSGSSTLSFVYTVQATDRETTTTIAFDPSIDLNTTGTIKDGAGNNATITLGAVETNLETLSSAIKFNGRMPYVQNIIVPTPRTYVAADTLEFVLEFDRNVTVNTAAGTPSLPVTIGSTVRNAYYVSAASSATSLVFRYTTVPGDVDNDGITVAAPQRLSMNSGTITATTGGENFVNTVGSFNNHDLTLPSMTSVLVGATQPAIQSVTIAPDASGAYGASTTSDNYFKIGEDILITLTFNDNMTVNQTIGTPRIPITIGATTRYATYLSGGDGQTSLIFKYTIVEGDSDTDGITLAASLDLNGGYITNAANTNTLLTIPTTSFPTRMVDGIRPTISAVTAPANGTYSAVTTPVGKNTLNFGVTWSEAVRTTTAYLPITINATARQATWVSGTDTASTTYRYTIVAADSSDTDGISMASPLVVTGTVYDSHGNTPNVLTYTLPTTTGVLVDRTTPTITGMTGPAAGTYTTGQNLDFVVTFSEIVDVSKVGTEPKFQVMIGSNTRDVVVTSSGSSNTHTFRYTVQATDTATGDPTYVATTLTAAAGSYIRDLGANPATLSFTAVAPSLAGIVIDEVAPTFTASTTAKTYVSAADGSNQIIITLAASEAVSITGGTPSITLDIGTGDQEATYNSGTSTPTSLKFVYNIDDTQDMDLDGLALGSPTINLNGATIEDSNNNAANLTIGTVTNLSTSYIAPHAVLWIKPSLNNTNRSGFTTKPSVTHTPSYSGNYLNFSGGGNLTVTSLGSSSRVVYMSMMTPASGHLFPQDLMGGELQLTSNSIDATTSTSTSIRSTSYTGAGTTHNNIFVPSTASKIEMTYPAGVTIPNTFISGGNQFTGSMREIIIFDTNLAGPQKDYVYSYLVP